MSLRKDFPQLRRPPIAVSDRLDAKTFLLRAKKTEGFRMGDSERRLAASERQDLRSIQGSQRIPPQRRIS